MDNNNEFDKMCTLVTSAFQEIGKKMYEMTETIEAIASNLDIEEAAPSEPPKVASRMKSELQIEIEKRIAAVLFDVVEAYGIGINARHKFIIDFTPRPKQTVIINDIALFKKED